MFTPASHRAARQRRPGRIISVSRQVYILSDWLLVVLVGDPLFWGAATHLPEVAMAMPVIHSGTGS